MSPSPDEELSALRRWLEEHWDPAQPLHAWWTALAGSGWSAPTWPRQWYGRGLSLAEAALVDQAIRAAGAVPGPGGFGVGMVGPTLCAHGDDEQRRRHMGPIVSGAVAWCQLFSEPGAGSDLAGLQTRAERDGEGWVVNGQKVWTSGGEIADWAMLLARTNIDVPKHAGISYFLIDMHQAGVEVRPLREMTGRAIFNQVFLTDARVTPGNLVGGEGNGWAVANTTLAYERALSGGSDGGSPARPGSVAGDLQRPAGEFAAAEQGEGIAGRSVWDRLVDLAQRSGRLRPSVRQELARLYSFERIMGVTAQRVRAEEGAGRSVPGAPNLAKMAQNRALRLQRDLTFSVLGNEGLLFDYGGRGSASQTGAPGLHELVEAALFAQAPPIYGGSEQIQRNIVGDRVLGLPREPRENPATPFRHLPHNT